MSSRKCEISDVDVHRASYAKPSRSKIRLENEKQKEMIIPEWLIEETVENNTKKFIILSK